jgi:hypothetical protein
MADRLNVTRQHDAEYAPPWVPDEPKGPRMNAVRPHKPTHPFAVTRGGDYDALSNYADHLQAVIDNAYAAAQEMSHDDHQAIVCVIEALESATSDAKSQNQSDSRYNLIPGSI